MYSKIIILRFPKSEVHKPIVYRLTKDYDLMFNILNATILPRREGVAVLEISGSKKNFNEGIKFLKAQGVQVQNASQEVKRNNRKCTDCGACTAVCPTGALEVQRPEMTVIFDQKNAVSVNFVCRPVPRGPWRYVRPTRLFLNEANNSCCTQRRCGLVDGRLLAKGTRSACNRNPLYHRI